MKVRFENPALKRLEEDPTYTHGLDSVLVKAFRKRLQIIRAAPDERGFYALKSLHYEKLKCDRAGQRSMRLNDQWRLILRIAEHDDGKQVVVIEIADYH